MSLCMINFHTNFSIIFIFIEINFSCFILVHSSIILGILFYRLEKGNSISSSTFLLLLLQMPQSPILSNLDFVSSTELRDFIIQ